MNQNLYPAPKGKPIYGTDFSIPLSETMVKLRSGISQIRGQCSDIGFAYSGWKGEMAVLEGGLTCMLMAMHNTLERLQEHEALIAAERAEAPDVPNGTRGTEA